MQLERRVPLPTGAQDPAHLEPLLDREWLVTNGLGGYASGTLSGVITRRYHGLLIAALPSPSGRMVMLNHLIESLMLPDGSNIQLTGEERARCALRMEGACFLESFILEMGLPVWRYRINASIIEKRVFMRYRQNTVQVSYALAGNSPVKLELRPCVHFRLHNEPLSAALAGSYSITLAEDFYQISPGGDLPVLRLALLQHESSFIADRMTIEEFVYRKEEGRGYEGREDLWSPGHYSLELSPGEKVVLLASTEPPEVIRALSPEEAVTAELTRRSRLLGPAYENARSGLGAELTLAADQFIITPVTRRRGSVRVNAHGDEMRSVIAGYHWFTDWGRDSMISLEGLTLVTGRSVEAGWILRTFASYIDHGLIPNMFPEGEEKGRYNTADATLWFFHALKRYLDYTADQSTLRLLIPRLLSVIEQHVKGTHFNIQVDPQDGLLSQGYPEAPLTWMDAHVGDWVVTPRRGKNVEINALWYNALRLLEEWCRGEGMEKAAQALAQHARTAQASFNARFWYAAGGYLYDIVDGERGDDAACRPNQLLAISLPYPVLAPERWEAVLNVVKQELWTPVGLRSLSPGHPGFKAQYFGDLRSRDAAYHQGTVWPWWLGPLVDAWLRVHPDDLPGARRLLSGLEAHLSEACIGSISEIFDAMPPYKSRGCISQAWSVAEALRAWVRTADPG